MSKTCSDLRRFALNGPAMGSRFDSPAARDAGATPKSDEDLWKALDEGRDPTA